MGLIFRGEKGCGCQMLIFKLNTSRGVSDCRFVEFIYILYTCNNEGEISISIKCPDSGL